MALWPFILVKEKNAANDKVLINHERIHLRQQIEMLLVPFYIVYITHYFINLIRYRHHDRAYRRIIFEREAYAMDGDLEYLRTRSTWNWLRF